MELNRTPTDQYAGYLVEDSDLEYSDCSVGGSSDDEDCSTQFRSYKSFERREPSSSEDEFEKEMAGEVMSAMKIMASPAAMALKDRETKTKKATNSNPAASSSNQQAGTSKGASASQEQPSSKYYDEVYFDSDDSSSVEDMREVEDGEGGGAPATVGRGKQEGAAKKVKKLTNDELFYDPDMDDDDEKWVKRQRMAYHNVKVSERLEQKKKAKQTSKVGGSSNAPAGGLPKSDAVLNCPACMSTVCLDCQRHDTYANQYRAMFVLNCRVLRDEVLKYVPKPDKKSRKRARGRGKAGSSRDGDAGEGSSRQDERQGGAEQEVADVYHPVRCKDCNTEIAVVDSDEVFHFFNVLPSAPS